MSDEKKPMPADGTGSVDRGRELAGQEASSSATPQPREQAENRRKANDGGAFDGGQSNRSYFGTGQLGERKVGANENAPTDED